MPIGGLLDPGVDLDQLDAGAGTLGVSQGDRYRAEFDMFGLSRKLSHWAGADPTRFPIKVPGLDLPAITGPSPAVTADDANDRYGVDGYLRFNQPTTEYDAAWLSQQARERRYRDNVLSLSRPTPLTDFGVSLAGTLTDPTGLAIMAATDGLGEAAFGAAGLGRAGAASARIASLGRVANYGFRASRILGEGAITNTPYVLAAAALDNYAGEEYGLGDGLRDIAAGAIFHGGMRALGFGFEAARDRLGRGQAGVGRMAGAPEPARAAPASDASSPYMPQAVQDLPIDARRGAFVKAIDDLADDRSVDVGALIEHERAPAETVGRLNEVTAAPDVPSFRPLREDTAVTTRGTEIPVRYGLVELSDLTTSHTDNLEPNAAFPPELQPRDRARAGAQARNYQLEAELNPKRLMISPDAEAGAPIVSPDGLVESGNGRTIALRRSAAKWGDAYARYLAELKAQGFDTTGMLQPVLVRMRTEPMGGAQRAALAREMNADVTERMSATEQAKADAARLPDQAFDLIGENEGVTTSPMFARAFLDKVAPDQVNQLVAPDGTLSPEGARRIKAAVLARAYGDERLVAQIFEGEETAGRQIAEGLAQAAPAWAKLRAAVGRGDVARVVDITDALTSAMDLVRWARLKNEPLAEILARDLGQTDMLSGQTISPATEAFLRLFYRDEGMTKPLAAEKLAAALRHYATEAGKVAPGPDLFGEVAGDDTARAILRNTADRFARNDPGDINVRAPGQSDPGSRPAQPPVIDLRRPGEVGDGGGRGVSSQGQPGAEGAGDAAGGFGFETLKLPDGTSRFDLQAPEAALEAGEERGHIGGYIENDGATWRIRRSDLPKAQRGQGVGVAMYEDLIRRAFAAGAREVVSDGEVSASAQRIYEALERRGFKVERAGELTDFVNREGAAAVFAKGSKTPVYRVTAPPKAAAGAKPVKLTGRQIIAADPELRALAEDTEAIATANAEDLPANAKDDPDTLAEALRATAVCLAEEAA